MTTPRRIPSMLPVAIERADTAGPGRVAGPVVVYGDRAKLSPSLRESFARGSIRMYERGLSANVQHDRRALLARFPGAGLTFRDSHRALYANIELPDTTLGRDVSALVESGRLSGFSMEFIPQKMQESPNHILHVRATMVGLALVDRPAYPQSEIDALKRWLDEPAPTVRHRWFL